MYSCKADTALLPDGEIVPVPYSLHFLIADELNKSKRTMQKTFYFIGPLRGPGTGGGMFHACGYCLVEEANGLSAGAALDKFAHSEVTVFALEFSYPVRAVVVRNASEVPGAPKKGKAAIEFTCEQRLF